MYFFLLKILIVAIFTSSLLGQEYQITSNSGYIPLKLDKFSKRLYYKNWFTDSVKSICLDGTNEKATIFPTVPSFANESHKSAYFELNNSNYDLFLYDFELDTSMFITQFSNIDIGSLSFSPNDINFVYSTSNIISSYYSFSDSIVHNLTTPIFAPEYIWENDTSIICMSSYGYGNSFLLNINLANNQIDTILIAADTILYTSISYNMELGCLAYAWRDYENAGINLFFLSTGENKEIYNYLKDDCLGTFIDYLYLEWSIQNIRLGFLGVDALNPLSQVYVYDTEMDKVLRLTEPFVNDEGIKYELTWLNEDSLSYVSFKTQQTPQIYGFDIITTLPINRYDETRKYKNSILIYPNPFNNVTTIKFDLIHPAYTEIKIYDTKGALAKIFNLGFLKGGGHKINWDGKNNDGHQISSGIYFGKLITKVRSVAGKDFFKLMYIK